MFLTVSSFCSSGGAGGDPANQGLQRGAQVSDVSLGRGGVRVQSAERKIEELRKDNVKLRAESFGMRNAADIAKEGAEADEVLAQKTPPIDDLWVQQGDMFKELGISQSIAGESNLKLSRGEAENERVERLQYLHLSEHIKLRSMLNSYQKVLDLWNMLNTKSDERQQVRPL